jgi:hypothetical protein
MSAVGVLGRRKFAGTDAVLERIRVEDADQNVRFQAACALQTLRTGKAVKVPELPGYASEEMTPATLAAAEELYPEVLQELKIEMLPEPKELELPDSYGMTGFATAGSPLARLMVLGQAIVPIVRQRFLDRRVSERERCLLLGLLYASRIPFPKEIENTFIDSFYAAKPSDRQASLEQYGRLHNSILHEAERQHEWDDPVKMDRRERLVCLLSANNLLRSEGKQAEQNLSTLDVAVPPPAPVWKMQAFEFNRTQLRYRCWQMLRLQQGEDAAAEYARDFLTELKTGKR